MQQAHLELGTRLKLNCSCSPAVGGQHGAAEPRAAGPSAQGTFSPGLLLPAPERGSCRGQRRLSPAAPRAHTYLQHCFFMLRPPNLGLSRQLVQTPQSSGTWQPEHCPQRLERRPFFTGGSCCALFLVTGLIGLIGGARGSASSEPAIDDLSIKTNV